VELKMHDAFDLGYEDAICDILDDLDDILEKKSANRDMLIYALKELIKEYE
jgi:hypothetical protein